MKTLDKLLDKLFCTEYSPLVEQGYQAVKKYDPSVTKRQVYKVMVKSKLIDKEGNPTDFAIKEGLVESVPNENIPDDSPTQDDTDLLAVFGRMKPEDFKEIDGTDQFAIEVKPLAKAIKEALADDTLSAKGRKAWTKVLEDAEQTLKNEHKEK